MNVFRKLTDFQIFRIITVISLLNVACLPSAMVGNKDNLDKLTTFAGAALLLPGLSDVPRDNDGKAIVPDDKTYLRVKLQDDPIPPPENKGLVHFIIDYEEISRDIYVSGDGNKEETKQFDFFTLTVENIEVKPVGKDKIFLPAPTKLIKIFEKNKKYSAVFNNLRLEVGEYEYLRVNLYELHGNAGNNKGKENVFHQVQVEGTTYPLNFIKKRIQFMDAFRIEKGKLTTLHSKPTQPKVIHYQKNNSEYRSQVEFNARGYNVNFPIDKIWINMKSISVTKSSGEVILLNDTPFRFDLLSLRGTAVLLVGNDMVPAGTYNHFTINLDDGNSIELEYESKPLLITNEYTKTFNVPGPFDLRGGRMTEIILDFDPNLSVFNTLDSGYVMEPTIKVVSILSMTPEQDIRVQQALGEYANAVIKEADVIFQGSVNSLNYVVANNIYNKPMIYTDMSLKVEDRLRGEIENPDNFPFRMIGGSVEGLTLRVTSMPEFKKEDTFLLFLKKYGSTYKVVRGEMGKVDL